MHAPRENINFSSGVLVMGMNLIGLSDAPFGAVAGAFGHHQPLLRKPSGSDSIFRTTLRCQYRNSSLTLMALFPIASLVESDLSGCEFGPDVSRESAMRETIYFISLIFTFLARICHA